MRQRLTSKIAADSKPKKTSSGDQRQIEGFEYDKTKAKMLKRSLHNINVSLGTLIAAMKELALLRGSEVSPDGMLGGRGYIMPFKDVKKIINEAVSNLSDVTDTLADELTNPKWGLSKTEKQKVKEDNEDINEDIEEVEEDISDDKKEDTPEIVEEEAEEEAEGEQEESPEEDDYDSKEIYVEDDDGEIHKESKTMSEKYSEKISPKDVIDSNSLERYKSIIEGNSKDMTTSVISKYIVANLTRGE